MSETVDTNASVEIGGSVAPGWAAVRRAFVDNFETTEEVGSGVSVYHRGIKVVDLWGGRFTEDTSDSITAGRTEYDEDTLQLVFSTTKGITAIALAMCVDRGLIAYDEPVARYWPEFAANGKADATVAQLVSHQCGLYTVDGPISLAEALDWTTITARLANTAPRWPIGTAHGYHALTFGWLAGELVRRVDPANRSLGTFVQEEIVRPLGVELWIGLPEEQVPRVSPMIPSPPPSDAVAAMLAPFIGPGTVGGDALTLNEAFRQDTQSGGLATLLFNTRQVQAVEMPAANAITNARSLAKIYAATLAPIDGIQLLSDETRRTASTTVTPDGEPDKCLVMATTFGMGFMTHGAFTPYTGPGSFGHFGAGGSVAYAQPERALGFGYVMNRMANGLIGDLRAQSLMDAAAACADAIR